MSEKTRVATTLPEALGIAALCFGWSIWSSLSSLTSDAQAGEFSDAAFQGLLFMEVVFAAIALTILRARNYAIETLYPEPSLRGAIEGVALYLCAILASTIALNLLSMDGANEPIVRMVTEAHISVPMAVALGLVNGAYEEVFLLGFLQRGLARYGSSIAIGLPLLVRLLYHLYQGPTGALSVLCFGGVLAFFYSRRPSLFAVVLAHALADIVPFTVGY